MRDSLTLAEARRLLAVEPGCGERPLRRAWARALSAGGDAERQRRLVAAYRLLRPAEASGLSFPPVPAAARPSSRVAHLPVSAAMAATGGWRTVQVDGRTLRLRIPANAAPGLRLRLAGVAADGGDLTIVLHPPRAAPRVAERLRERFVQAWAA